MPRSAKELKSPTEETLMSAGDNSLQNEKVRMKKQLGLLEGVAIILGIILGSGIFISPGGVIKEVDSLGVSLVVWILCGILSMIGAICYAELGTSIPKSGGDYAYIYEAFGPLPAFLYLWAANLIFVPTTNAIMGLTFANYVVKPFFPNCEIPEWGVSLLAAATICFLSFLNSYDVKMTTKLQIVFMFSKIAALATVICLGLVYLFQGNTQNFSAPFKDSVTDPGKISLAFYSGIFSYSGWSYLNFMTEELRDPFVNLPRAIYISIPLVTIIYVLANIAYGAVLTAQQMAASQAIAVDFAYSSMGTLAWMMPIMVAISAFGGLCVHIMTSSRMLFVGARNGHFPVMLSHINVNKFTPAPSLAFLNVLSLLMLYTSDIYSLITYCTIVETAFVTMSVSAILYLRWKRPKMARPIKVHIIVPIFFIIICIFLLCLPCYVSPFEVGMGLLITVSGIPAYYCGIHWKTKPQWFTNAMNKMTVVCQKIFMSAVEEKEEEDQ